MHGVTSCSASTSATTDTTSKIDDDDDGTSKVIYLIRGHTVFELSHLVVTKELNANFILRDI